MQHKQAPLPLLCLSWQATCIHSYGIHTGECTTQQQLPGLTLRVHRHGWRYEQCMGVPESLQKSSEHFHTSALIYM